LGLIISFFLIPFSDNFFNNLPEKGLDVEMSNNEPSPKDMSNAQTLNNQGRLRGEPRLKKQLSIITENPSSELNNASSLRAPLLQSNLNSQDQLGPERPLSKMSSFDDIIEVKGGEQYLSPSEKADFEEKDNPRMMIPLPMKKHNQHWFRVRVLFKFSLPILLYSISNLLIETFTLLFAGRYLNYQAVAAIGKTTLYDSKIVRIGKYVLQFSRRYYYCWYKLSFECYDLNRVHES